MPWVAVDQFGSVHKVVSFDQKEERVACYEMDIQAKYYGSADYAEYEQTEHNDYRTYKVEDERGRALILNLTSEEIKCVMAQIYEFVFKEPDSILDLRVVLRELRRPLQGTKVNMSGCNPLLAMTECPKLERALCERCPLYSAKA